MAPSTSERSVRARSRSGGQALIELAIAAPILIVLLLGSLDLTLFYVNSLRVSTATREGARIAAELGGGQDLPGTPTTAQLDAVVLGDVRQETQGMQYAAVSEIDVYTPSAADGHYDPVSDPADEYNGSGVALPKQSFPLTLRDQKIPDETSIGVRVVWNYNSPAGLGIGSITFDQYGVFKAAAVP